MALAATGQAIGAVSETLRERLTAALGPAVDNVTVGRPEPGTSNLAGSRLNLFLYEIHVDEFLRNEPLDDGQPPPLWLVLRYLMTAFDEGGDSDTSDAHDILGEGMRAIHGINFLQPTAGTLGPLRDNPMGLKVTFDPATADLLSKLMQGPDQVYRCSTAFQVRPVLLAPAEPSSYSQLVGIDYSAGEVVIGERGVQIVVLPSLGPTLDDVTPGRFEVGAALEITGSDLNVEHLVVRMDGVDLPITRRLVDRIECVVPTTLANGTLLSAGSHAITAVQALPTGHNLSSNAVSGGLLPRIDGVSVSGITPINPNPGAPLIAVIDLTGILLSTSSDATFLGLSSQGKVIQLFDNFTRPTTDQTQLRLSITDAQAVPAGIYRVILRVNGQQALRSPEVSII
jgi:hypothetical protein